MQITPYFNSVRVLLLFFLLTVFNHSTVSGSVFGSIKQSTERADLSQAVIAIPKKTSDLEKKAVQVLIEEVKKRTGIEWLTSSILPKKGKAFIALSSGSWAKGAEPSSKDWDALEVPKSEGYRILSLENTSSGSGVWIQGADEHGLLYGVGKLLRKLSMTSGKVTLSTELQISSSPEYPLRGHQLAYRSLSNTYDAWDVDQFDQYIRELAMFGANAIELVPPITTKQHTSPYFSLPPLEMMTKLSEVIDSYGMQVWIWYPFVGKDYESDSGIDAQMQERKEIFEKLPRIDAVFIPGSDPGELHPKQLFPFGERIAKMLQQYHPSAKIWFSPQNFRGSEEWLNSFYAYVNKKPDWLGGVVHGPWVKTPIEKVPQLIPADMPIRNYPDITHCLESQFPVPFWDVAFATTLGREGFNPRPVYQKYIHNKYAAHTIGSISYSEGINDDLNKFVWSDQDWDSSTPVIETLRDYAKLFISEEDAEEITRGILGLERNFDGPLLINDGVEHTFDRWQRIEGNNEGLVEHNYRLQLFLLRAYYDASLKKRLVHETWLEQKAKDIMAAADKYGAEKTMKMVEEVYAEADEEKVAAELIERCYEFADATLSSVGYKTRVHEKNKGLLSNRAAYVDQITSPLNSRFYVMAEFKDIRKMETEKEKIDAIKAIFGKSKAGPGGFYTDFSKMSIFQQVENALDWEKDPSFLGIPFRNAIRANMMRVIKRSGRAKLPYNKLYCVSTHYGTPLVMNWNDLNPELDYTISVNYLPRGGSLGHNSVKLASTSGEVIHDFIEIKKTDQVMGPFPIPASAYKNGKLELLWQTQAEQHGAQLLEVWIDVVK